MFNFAKHLANEGWLLRSGGAKGADRAFECGCSKAKGEKEIFYAKDATMESLIHAKVFCSWWYNCDDYAKKLKGRNSMIVLGCNLDAPVDMLVCWTTKAQIIGGTGHALQIAQKLGIPVYNLFHTGAQIHLGDQIKYREDDDQ